MGVSCPPDSYSYPGFQFVLFVQFPYLAMQSCFSVWTCSTWTLLLLLPNRGAMVLVAFWCVLWLCQESKENQLTESFHNATLADIRQFDQRQGRGLRLYKCTKLALLVFLMFFFLDASNNAATRYATHVTRTRCFFALKSFKASINSWYLLVSLLRRDIWNILRSGESSLAMFCLVMVAWWDFVVLARNLCHHFVTDRENNKLREQQSWISISCIDRDVVRQLPCLLRVDALVL